MGDNVLKKMIIHDIVFEINNRLYEENVISIGLYNYCHDKLVKIKSVITNECL